MSYFESETVKGGRPEAYPVQAGVIYCSSGKYTVGDTFTTGDLVGIAVLPAGCVGVDFILGSDDIDSGTANKLTVGILNENATDLIAGSDFITESTVGQTGGIARADKLNLMSGIDVDNDNARIIAIKNATAAGTAVAGTLYGTLLYRAVEYGE